jgi:hypothetical protein
MIPQKEFDKVGHRNDAKGRITRARSYLFSLIDRARECIYKYGHFITSTAIERMLHPVSVVPTVVRFLVQTLPFLTYQILVSECLC